MQCPFDLYMILEQQPHENVALLKRNSLKKIESAPHTLGYCDLHPFIVYSILFLLDKSCNELES